MFCFHAPFFFAVGRDITDMGYNNFSKVWYVCMSACVCLCVCVCVVNLLSVIEQTFWRRNKICNQPNWLILFISFESFIRHVADVSCPATELQQSFECLCILCCILQGADCAEKHIAYIWGLISLVYLEGGFVALFFF